MDKTTNDLLAKHFDTAFASPNGITKLRELILTLAMQGKLVEQSHTDGNANELIKKIKTEKKSQVKAGRRKNIKTRSDTAQPSLNFNLPQSWIWTRIGAIGNVFNGNSINSHEKQTKYAGVTGIPYLSTKDIGYGLDTLDYENGICIPEPVEKFKIAHNGAVLICSEGGSAGKKCGITEQDICFGNKLFANELFGGIPSKFILYFYLSPIFRESFNSVMTGIIGGVSMAKFQDIPVPLPPLKEQKRIVAKIDQLMAKCDELEKLHNAQEEKLLTVHTATIQKLLNYPEGSAWDFLQQHFGELYTVKENVTELRKAILQLAVIGKLVPQNPNNQPASELLKEIEVEKDQLKKHGNTTKIHKLQPVSFDDIPYHLPQGWALTRLGSILSFGPTNGYSPKAVDYETAVRSLTLSATTSGIFKEQYSKYIDEVIAEDSTLWLKNDDILVQRGNTIEYVGVPAIYRGESKKFIYPDLMMKIRVFNQMSTDFIHMAMSAEFSREYLRNYASGTSSTMPKINQKALCNLPIAIPPSNEQHCIVNKVNQLLVLCDKLRIKIEDKGSTQEKMLDVIMANI